jgi:G6PDH family F420-dependent oxidoreductase
VTEFGYFLACEQHGPLELVEYARRAEEAGFDFALISDHFHPWIDRQGNSPFVWGVLGGVAAVTERLRIGTAVTCPTTRIHPAIVAQAAATAACMLPERFFLGVGSGENLNEHILGSRWPAPRVRLEMLEEAVAIIRLLWQGGMRSHRGRHYTVENARIYTLPEHLPPIVVAASGRGSARLAGRVGDGLITLAPSRDLFDAYGEAGGAGKPRYTLVGLCFADDEPTARRVAREWWPTVALEGELFWELPLPRHFEQAVSRITEEDVAAVLFCGPDPDRIVEKVAEHVALGCDRVCLAQVGPDQEGFFRFWQEELLPRLRPLTEQGPRVGRDASP